MRSEVLSTARPTWVRLVGFVCLAAGAVLAGVGATRAWASVGFPDDALRAADVPIHGTDVWEGKVVLFGAAVALLAVLGMRISASGVTRRALSVLLLAIGAACVLLPVLDAVRAEDRFGGAGGADRMAERLAVELELPEDVVRAQLQEQFRRELRVEVEPAIWVSAAGGVLLVAGGWLGWVWAASRRPDAREAVVP